MRLCNYGMEKNNIEKKEILAESPRRGYEIIRLTRLKYKKSLYSFLDIRLFQRGYDEEGDEKYYPTKKGIQFREDHFQQLIGKWTLVPSILFHPLILKKAWPSVERNEFDSAIFRAFKAVEVAVRKAANLPQECIGISLMRNAFDPKKGALSDKTLPKGEREALSHLFTGAIGLYKNPHSHRELELTFKDTFEMLLVASHLLYIIDRQK